MTVTWARAACFAIASACLMPGSAAAANYCGATLIANSAASGQGAVTHALKIGGKWRYTIVVDPSIKGLLRRHVLLHECGHVKHGPDETVADCYALRAGGTSKALVSAITARFGAGRAQRFLTSCGGGTFTSATVPPGRVNRSAFAKVKRN